jgi:hypothetical protein
MLADTAEAGQASGDTAELPALVARLQYADECERLGDFETAEDVLANLAVSLNTG